MIDSVFQTTFRDQNLDGEWQKKFHHQSLFKLTLFFGRPTFWEIRDTALPDSALRVKVRERAKACPKHLATFILSMCGFYELPQAFFPY